MVLVPREQLEQTEKEIHRVTCRQSRSRSDLRINVTLSHIKGSHTYMTSEIIPTISSDPYSSAKVRLPTVTEAVISVAPW